jgi:hypothetical protein
MPFDQIDTLMRGHPRSKALQDDDDTVTYTQARTSYKTPRDERQNPPHTPFTISPDFLLSRSPLVEGDNLDETPSNPEIQPGTGDLRFGLLPLMITDHGSWLIFFSRSQNRSHT